MDTAASPPDRKAARHRDPPLRVARIYEPVSADGGARLLVDRLWPRGVRTEDAHLDAWLKDVAPSAALRRWYGHDPVRWTEFARRYRAELSDTGLASVLEWLRRGPVTLLTATRDLDRSGARVLADVVVEKLARG